MKKTLRISKTDIARYELEIMSRGVCQSLAPLCFAEEQGAFAVEISMTGYGSVDAWLSADRSFMFDAYRRLLRLLRKLAEALCDAERYLVSVSHLSLAPDDILVDGESLRLIPSPVPSPLEASFENLLISMENDYPQTHAAYILDSLPEYYDAASLLRFLTNLELDIMGI